MRRDLSIISIASHESVEEHDRWSNTSHDTAPSGMPFFALVLLLTDLRDLLATGDEVRYWSF